jgi:hypothetical protein
MPQHDNVEAHHVLPVSMNFVIKISQAFLDFRNSVMATDFNQFDRKILGIP